MEFPRDVLTVDAFNSLPAAVKTVRVTTDAMVGVTGIIAPTTASRRPAYSKYFCSDFLTSTNYSVIHNLKKTNTWENDPDNSRAYKRLITIK